MRVVVVGDTHGNIDQIKHEIKLLPKPDLLIHTGDFYQDGIALGKHFTVDHHVVIGNCDRGVKGDKQLLLNLCGHRVFLTHGHLQNVKITMNNLHYRALQDNYAMVIFGHTHVPYLQKTDGIWYMNPGSATYPRSHSKGSYGFIEISDKEIIPRIIEF